ncbi:MAG: ribonuclease Z [Bacteroidales bacterium]|nr:ribonuclease Z [Bacteroidales bacterium]
MKDFTVSILGNGSAVPTAFQNPSSQLVKYKGLRFLVDCGEGTQMQFIKYGFSYRNLSHIFISHMHGDHYLGLAGLVSTFHLFRREAPLHIYGPSPLESILQQQFQISETHLQFELIFHPLKGDQQLYEDDYLQILSFPLKHSVPTWGFRFQEKSDTDRRLKKEFVEEFKPKIEQMRKIKQGADYITPGGNVLKNKEITADGHPPRSFAYCSDTIYDESIVAHIKGVDLLYHEATFGNATEEKAKDKMHATAAQAANIAKMADVKRLLLGHFSARFSKNLKHLLVEAQDIFPRSMISEQGKTYEL